jgi:hypothetical protein
MPKVGEALAAGEGEAVISGGVGGGGAGKKADCQRHFRRRNNRVSSQFHFHAISISDLVDGSAVRKFCVLNFDEEK